MTVCPVNCANSARSHRLTLFASMIFVSSFISKSWAVVRVCNNVHCSDAFNSQQNQLICLRLSQSLILHFFASRGNLFLRITKAIMGGLSTNLCQRVNKKLIHSLPPPIVAEGQLPPVPVFKQDARIPCQTNILELS